MAAPKSSETPTVSAAVQQVASEANIPVSVLAEALAAAINATKAPARITIANRVARNPMNPTNRVRKFDKDYFQNFNKLEEDDLTDEEFDLLPQLREGNYVPNSKDGYLIEVIHVKRGAHRGMHIRYDNGSVDTRMEMMAKCPTFAAILRKCIDGYADQKVERKRKRKEEEED